MTTIGVVAVLKREIITPTTGEASYIHQTNSEVHRWNPNEKIAFVHAAMLEKYPDAIGFEVYQPQTDPLQQKRF